MSKIHLTINGQQVEAESGQTVLQAASAAGIHIPTLCYHPALPPEESCRICVVELFKGKWSSLVAACVYPAREGMVIETDTPQVHKARRTILELILSDHPSDCMTCNSTGNCELQDLAYEYGIKEVTLGGQSHSYPIDPDPNPFIHWDMNKCVMCRRCIRACSEVQCAHVLTKAERGFNQRISTAFGELLENSGCEFDGQCLAFCPVDALSEKAPRGKARTWEMEKTRTVCPLCACGCLFDLNTKGDQVLKVTSNFSSPANLGALCNRGRFGYEYLNHPDRLKAPLLKKGNDWVEAGWEEALEVIADKFRAVQEKFGPEALGFLLSSSLTNEELYLWQKFARSSLKTSRLAHPEACLWAPVKKIMDERLGLSGMTNPTGDLINSSGILLIGSQIMTTHPIAGIKIRQAVQKGARLLTIDSQAHSFSNLAYQALIVPSGTEDLILNGILSFLVQQNKWDQEFVAQRTSGLEGLREALSKTTLESVAAETGLPLKSLQEAADFVAHHRPLALVCPPPLNGRPFPPALVQSALNLQLLMGNLGQSGGGLDFLVPQANGLGAWEFGAGRPDYTDEELWSDLKAGNIKALFLAAEDPYGNSHLSPARQALLNTLGDESFLVVQDLFLSQAARKAQVVLPALPSSEKTGTFLNMERRVQLLKPGLPVQGQGLWTGELLGRLALRLGLSFPVLSAAETFQEIALTFPLWSGLNYSRLEKEGLSWPCPDPDSKGTPILFESDFPVGKVRLVKT